MMKQKMSHIWDLIKKRAGKEAIAQIVPEQIFAKIFNKWFAVDSNLKYDNMGWYLENEKSDLDIYLPTARTAIRFSQSSIQSRLNLIRNKYQLPGFVEVVEGDSVVDIGAFIGEFSLSIYKDAEWILAIEPSPNNFECLNKNIYPIDNINATDHLLWEEETTMEFNIATDGSESTIFDPHTGMQEMTIDRQTTQFKSIVDEIVDFVKVEAEGAELEVIRGFNTSKINKITVDCSEPNPRIDGSPEQEIKNYLSAKGFSVKIVEKDIHGTMLFANRDVSE